MRRAWTGALLLLVGLGACGGSDDERGADERGADERGAENRHEARGSESRPAESADPSPAAPTEGDAEATGPGPRLRGAGFDVVPRAPVRGAVVAFAFPAPHRVLAGTDQGALLLFDVPSGHVRAYRRVARTQPVTELRLADEGPAAAAHFMDPNAGYVYGGVVWDLRRDRLWDPPSFDGARLRLSPDGAWAVQLGPEEERLEARSAPRASASRATAPPSSSGPATPSSPSCRRPCAPGDRPGPSPAYPSASPETPTASPSAKRARWCSATP